MTDEELERLKNKSVDFPRVLNAAQKVDPAKVKEREEREKEERKQKGEPRNAAG